MYGSLILRVAFIVHGSFSADGTFEPCDSLYCYGALRGRGSLSLYGTLRFDGSLLDVGTLDYDGSLDDHGTLFDAWFDLLSSYCLAGCLT